MAVRGASQPDPGLATDEGNTVHKAGEVWKYIAWDVQKNRQSAEFPHLLKYPSFASCRETNRPSVTSCEAGNTDSSTLQTANGPRFRSVRGRDSLSASPAPTFTCN